MTKLLRGAVLTSHVNALIRQHFAQETGQKVLRGKRGRPFTKTIEDVANNYLAPFPAELAGMLQERPDLIEGFIDALCNARRPLTEEESAYILNGRDATAMGTLDGEPVQVDIFNRYSVPRKENERMGYAVYRRFNEIKQFVQEEANRFNRTLYILVERYAIERNLRDELTAVKHSAPLSAVGLMSKNIFTIVVTDNLKDFKGFIATLAVVSPEVKTVEDTVEDTVEEVQEVTPQVIQENPVLV